jgi:hypothetical protein
MHVSNVEGVQVTCVNLDYVNGMQLLRPSHQILCFYLLIMIQVLYLISENET